VQTAGNAIVVPLLSPGATIRLRMFTWATLACIDAAQHDCLDRAGDLGLCRPLLWALRAASVSATFSRLAGGLRRQYIRIV